MGAQLHSPLPTAIVVFDIDGVVRDVGNSYRRALADTVEQFTEGAYRPSQADIDRLKAEGIWNNDWEASREFIYRYFEQQGRDRSQISLDYDAVVAFFQSRYRGADPNNPDSWTGYICQEPLLMQASYLEHLTQAGILWGFFSGATRGSASYVLERRLGLTSPVLVAMEDAPGKPDPTGLFETIQRLETAIHPSTSDSSAINSSAINSSVNKSPVIYVGDTVADLQTVEKARLIQPDRQWIGVGILPPHAQVTTDYASRYTQKLQETGASVVLNNVEELTANQIDQLVQGNRAG